VHDPDGDFLERWLAGLAAHTHPQGEGWLVLSDLAEHLGLRAPGEVERCVTAHGLTVKWQHDLPASHRRARDVDDPLHAARSTERVVIRGIGRQ